MGSRLGLNSPVARAAAIAAFLAGPALLAETHTVANIFKPLSAPAEAIHEISILALLICTAIFVVVGGLLAYAVVRFRSRPGDDTSEPPQVYGSVQLEMAWTAIPILVVVVLVVATLRTTAAIQNAPLPPDALQVRVVGHQWWWEIEYPGLGIVTANELHVPVSARDRRRPTAIHLESADVIHSFWVPQMAGKTDLIPSRTNRMWLEPYQTGTFLGNCAEYCGTQHAKMMLRVVVDTPEEFDRWVAAQKAALVESPAAQQGRDVFLQTSCVNCHRIQGTSANGVFGPDLSRLMTRQTLAAGAAANTPENLRRWLRDPATIKPGCLMPNMRLTPTEVEQIATYLETLR